MKALILAAGYATRLYPLTKRYPKSLLPVRGRPIIDYALEKLESIPEIDEVIVVTNNKFITHFRKWQKSRALSKKVSLLNDLTRSNETRRGAIGDLDFAIRRKNLRDDLLIVGGDNIFDAGLLPFVEFSKDHPAKPVIGVFDIGKKKEAFKYGVVRLDKNKRVVDFKEKPLHPKSSLVGMCVYFFPKETLGLIKDFLKSKAGKKDATGFYIDWLRSKKAVYGFVFRGKWYDIGDKKFLNAAKESFRKS
jgi:glucose-1-phosphate thymidylyltransferase